MRIIDKGSDEPLNFPGVCVFTRDSEGPFLDTDTYLNAKDLDGVNPYAYIHVQKVVDMGRVVGMVPKEDFEVLAEQVQVYGERVAELEKLLEAVQTIKDAESVLAAS
jgi:hypothetical protein